MIGPVVSTGTTKRNKRQKQMGRMNFLPFFRKTENENQNSRFKSTLERYNALMEFGDGEPYMTDGDAFRDNVESDTYWAKEDGEEFVLDVDYLKGELENQLETLQSLLEEDELEKGTKNTEGRKQIAKFKNKMKIWKGVACETNLWEMEI